MNQSATQVRGPMRGSYHPHTAIRKELADLEFIVDNLDVNSNFGELERRVDDLIEFVGFHAKTEEDIFYPAVDDLRAGMGETFLWDHRADEEYFENIKNALARINSERNQSALNELKTNVRGLNVLLSAHSRKEDDILIPLLDTKLGPQEQGELLSRIGTDETPEQMGRLLKWMISRITNPDRADYLGIMKLGVPPEAFEGIKNIVAQSIPPNEWDELQIQLN